MCYQSSILCQQPEYYTSNSQEHIQSNWNDCSSQAEKLLLIKRTRLEFAKRYLCNDQPYCIRCSTHGLLLWSILLHISNGSVSTSLVGHVLYLADLMSATCIPHYHLMVHRYIYSRYSPVFLMLYQLYHSLPFSTLISSSSLYLSVATWVTPQGRNNLE